MNTPSDLTARSYLAGGARRVVLADSFPDECAMYVEMLRHSGFDVRVVPTTLPEALQEITRQPPHLVVTRIRPLRFGIELIESMKRNSATAAVPTLALTTSILPEVTRDAWIAGADEVLLLPANIDRWRRIVHALAHRVANSPAPARLESVVSLSQGSE